MARLTTTGPVCGVFCAEIGEILLAGGSFDSGRGVGTVVTREITPGLNPSRLSIQTSEHTFQP